MNQVAPEISPYILVVDDDNRLRRLLTRYLMGQNFRVAEARQITEAHQRLQQESFDLMILDVMMPGGTGLELMARLRAAEAPPQLQQLPVLMLTAMSSGPERISGLNSGVDDYLTKPFEPEELVLRLRNILRRTQSTQPATRLVNLGEHQFDLQRRCLWRGPELVPLTSTEAALLYVLAERADMPISRYDLCEEVGEGVSPRTIDVQIARLRRKIEPNPAQPQFIQTVRHTGYVLRPLR